MLGHQRVLVVELPARREYDFVSVAALAHVEDVVLGDFVADADAARAHDATLGVVNDGGSETDAFWLVDRLSELSLQRALVLVVVILELALAGLVADGAIDRVIEQQKLLHGSLCGLDLVVGRRNHHAVGGLELTGGLKLGLGGGDVLALGFVKHQLRHRHLAAALDVNQAHSTVRSDRKTGVPAVVRNLDALAPGRVHDGLSRLEADLFAI